MLTCTRFLPILCSAAVGRPISDAEADQIVYAAEEVASVREPSERPTASDLARACMCLGRMRRCMLARQWDRPPVPLGHHQGAKARMDYRAGQGMQAAAFRIPPLAATRASCATQSCG